MSVDFRCHQATLSDQIIQITQLVSDGFQSKPPACTMAAQLDYSEADNRVFEEDIILTMFKLGVPMQMLRWLSFFHTLWSLVCVLYDHKSVQWLKYRGTVLMQCKFEACSMKTAVKPTREVSGFIQPGSHFITAHLWSDR